MKKPWFNYWQLQKKQIIQVLIVLLIFVSIPITAMGLRTMRDLRSKAQVTLPAIEITADARQTFHQNGVPHIDSAGNILTSYDSAKSIFPIGIYWPSYCKVDEPITWTRSIGAQYEVIINVGSTFNETEAHRVADIFITDYNQTSTTVKVPEVTQLYFTVRVKQTGQIINQGQFVSDACQPTNLDYGNIAKLKSAGFDFGISLNNYLYSDITNKATIHPAAYEQRAGETGFKLVNDLRGDIGDVFSLYRDDPTMLGWLLSDDAYATNLLSCLTDQSACDQKMSATYSQLSGLYNSSKPQTTNKIFFLSDPGLQDRRDPWAKWWPQFMNLGDASSHYFYPDLQSSATNSIGMIADSVSWQTRSVAPNNCFSQNFSWPAWHGSWAPGKENQYYLYVNAGKSFNASDPALKLYDQFITSTASTVSVNVNLPPDTVHSWAVFPSGVLTYAYGPIENQKTSFCAGAVSPANVKPSWFIPRAFVDHYDFFGNPVTNPQLPSATHERAFVYTAIIHGADGIVYFSWDSATLRQHKAVGMRPNPPTSYSEGGETASALEISQSTALWNSIDASQGGLNKELKDLTPVILSPTAKTFYQVFVDQTPISAAPIRTILKFYNGEYYLFAVNIDNATIKAGFSFPGNLSGATTLYESGRIPNFSENKLIDDFAPFAVHIYRFQLPSAKVGDLDGDGDVDILDLSKLITFWGATGGVADINKDGTVDVFDLSILLSNWGS